MSEETKDAVTDLEKGKFIGLDVVKTEISGGKDENKKDLPKVEVFTVSNADAAKKLADQFGLTKEVTTAIKDAREMLVEEAHKGLQPIVKKHGRRAILRFGNGREFRLDGVVTNPIPKSDKVKTTYSKLKVVEKTGSIKYLSKENETRLGLEKEMAAAAPKWK